MVWGCMLSSGVGFLCRVYGSINAQVYQSILDDELMETLDWYGLNKNEITFQQDNASCHVAKSTMEWFKNNVIRTMTWPAQSSDLNPIEHLLDHVKRRLQQLPKPKDTDELWDQVVTIWNEITPSQRATLVHSVHKRLAAVRKAKGSYTTF